MSKLIGAYNTLATGAAVFSIFSLCVIMLVLALFCAANEYIYGVDDDDDKKHCRPKRIIVKTVSVLVGLVVIAAIGYGSAFMHSDTAPIWNDGSYTIANTIIKRKDKNTNEYHYLYYNANSGNIIFMETEQTGYEIENDSHCVSFLVVTQDHPNIGAEYIRKPWQANPNIYIYVPTEADLSLGVMP